MAKQMDGKKLKNKKRMYSFYMRLIKRKDKLQAVLSYVLLFI